MIEPASKSIRRRDALKQLGAVALGTLLKPRILIAKQDVRIAGHPSEIAVSHVSARTVRVRITARERTTAISEDGALAPDLRGETKKGPHLNITTGGLRVQISHEPLVVHFSDSRGRRVQQLRIDESTGSIAFQLGDAPVLGMGEGGPQFDRRGNVDRMRSGQGGYRLRTHGGRVPVQWLIGTSGWAMFIHQPLGSFDLTGAEGKFTADPATALPMDIFVVDAEEPIQAMAEYAPPVGAGISTIAPDTG